MEARRGPWLDRWLETELRFWEMMEASDCKEDLWNECED
jgi:hypothetical protein